jgi:hypothetical protein
MGIVLKLLHQGVKLLTCLSLSLANVARLLFRILIVLHDRVGVRHAVATTLQLFHLSDVVSHLLTVVADLIRVVHSLNVVTRDKHVDIVNHRMRSLPVIVQIERDIGNICTLVSIIRLLVMTTLDLVLVEEARMIVSLVHSQRHFLLHRALEVVLLRVVVGLVH